MLIYILTILILFVFTFIDENNKVTQRSGHWMQWVSFLLLVLQVGLRWETGTDWDPYLNHFENTTDLTSIYLSEFEFGYSLFVWLVNFITHDYSIFLLVHAVIYYFLIFKSFKSYSPYFYMTLILYYTLSMGMMGSNRQLIALAICIYSLRFVIEKKTILFLLFVFIASFFHTTAFLFVVFCFLNKEIKPIILFIILGCTLIIGKTQLPVIIFSLFGEFLGGNFVDKSIHYTGDTKDFLDAQLSIIGLIKRLTFFCFFYYNRKFLAEKLAYYTVMLNGYMIGIAFYFLFADSLLVMVSRGSLYFNMMEPLLISSQLCLIKGKENKIFVSIILLLFSIIFLYQSIAAYPELFDPYKGLFINSDFQRIMY